MIWYLNGTFPIKQPRGLLIQGWHYISYISQQKPSSPPAPHHPIIWAMVNTHYMVDGHPIHNKDPYNGYYKSLWTIGWLAPINGYQPWVLTIAHIPSDTSRSSAAAPRATPRSPPPHRWRLRVRAGLAGAAWAPPWLRTMEVAKGG